jgi:hypothetical protein
MSTERYLESRPALAGGAGDDLELDREEWPAVCPPGDHPGAVAAVRGLHAGDLHSARHACRDCVHG